MELVADASVRESKSFASWQREGTLWTASVHTDPEEASSCHRTVSLEIASLSFIIGMCES